MSSQLLAVAAGIISALFAILTSVLGFVVRGEIAERRKLQDLVNAHANQLSAATAKTTADDARLNELHKDMGHVRENLSTLSLQLATLSGQIATLLRQGGAE